MPDADVLIVGAGPAGSAAATFLARDGLDVVVVDRATFPRDKICGDGLTPRAVGVLKTLGLETWIRDMGFLPLREYRCVSSRGETITTAVPSLNGRPDCAYVIPRRELDLRLVETARAAGAVVREGTHALHVERLAGAGAVVTVRNPGEAIARLRARVLLAADGSRSSFSRMTPSSGRSDPSAIGLRAYMEGVDAVEGALHFFLDRQLLPGYGWIFPGGREGAPANVGVIVRAAALRHRRQSLRDLFEEFLSPGSLAWSHLRHARVLSRPSASPLKMDFPKGRRRDGAVLFVGDAAGLINPLSGEGIGYALESGQAAAQAIARALRSGQLHRLADYEATIRHALLPEFLGARVVRGVLAQPWGNGLGNDIMVRLARRQDVLGRTVSRGFQQAVV
jgi:geranylgeranyl reductase family protein